MKRAHVAAVLVLGIAATILSANGQGCVAPPSGLVAWWPAESNAADVTGTNAGTLENGTIFSSGKVGQAFNFDGANDDVRIPASAALNVGASTGFTMEFWMNPAKQTIAPLVEWNNGLGNWGVHFWQSVDIVAAGDGVGNLVANVFDTSGGTHHIIAPSGLLTTNVYQHVALTYDKTSGIAVIYHNGSVVKSQNLGVFTPQTSYDLYLGRRASGAFSTDHFKGSLDEVSLYNRALTSNEIAAIFVTDSAGKCAPTPPVSCVTPPANLVAWWRGEGDAKDVLGAHDGSFPYGSAFATGTVAQAWDFDGSFRRVSVPDSAAFKLTNGLTLEAWVYPRQYNGFIMFRGDNRGGFDSWVLDAYQPGYATFQIDDAANNYANVRAPLQLNQWQHVAATWDRTTGDMKVYINGALSVQTNTTLIPIADLDPGQEPAIGIGNHGGTFHQFPFNGLIDESSIYARALSAAEILAIYQAGSAGKCVPVSPPPTVGVPQIASFSPALGSNGTVVTLTGTNFSSVAASNIVYFGAVRAAVTLASPTSLTVVVPSGATYAPPSVTVAGLSGQANSPFMPTFDGGGAEVNASSFDAKLDLPVGGIQQVVLIGDLDGDGKPDVVAANATAGSVSVYRNISASGSLTAGSFAPRVDLPTDTYPYACAVADVDGDGKLDIIVGNNGSGSGASVSVFRNTSTPGTINSNSFDPSVNFATATGPSRIAVGDLDGDGKLDLAVCTAGSNSGVSVLRNTGSAGSVTAGSFAAYVHFPTGPNSWDVKIGDLDGDGKRDLVASSYDAGTVSMLRNLSTPGSLTSNSFAAKVDITLGTVYNTAIADLDGDGKLDLVATKYFAASVAVMRNTSSVGSLTSNSFAAPISFATEAGPRDVAIGDIDGDGKADVVVCALDASRISVLRSTASNGVINASSFAPRVDFVTGAGPVMGAIGDLDSDGRPDMVASSWLSSSISILRNTVAPAPPYVPQPVPQITSFSPALGSNGSVVTLIGTNFSSVAASNIVYFGAVRAAVTLASPTSLTVVVPSGATYAAPSVTVAGLSGQAASPFVPTFDNGGTSIDSSSFAAKFDLPATSAQLSVAIGDLDGDGKPDVVTSDAFANSVSVYRNISASGSLTAGSFAPRVDFPTGSYPYSCTVGDVDGDGKLDIIVGNNGNGGGASVSVFRNTSTPGTISSSSFASGVVFATATGPTDIAVGDLDGDGRVDLAVLAAGGGGVSVLRNTGVAGAVDAGSFAAYVQFPTGPNGWNVKIADLDGDGKRDLVASSYDAGTVSLLRNLSSPGSLTSSSFAPKVDFTVGTTFKTAIGDLDGDGKPELVVTKYTGAAVAVMRNTSSVGALNSGSFAAPVSFATGAGPRDVAIGDIDGDGKPDLAVCAYDATRISVLRNTSAMGSIAANSFASKVDYVSGASPSTIAIGDLDGDGRPDLAASSWGSSFLSVFKNTVWPKPPAITQQPASLTVVSGTPVNFSVGVGGSSPFAYQWRFNGTNISGATNSTYGIAAAQENQAGNYSVFVSNPFDSVESSNALLTVLPPPPVPVIYSFAPGKARAGEAVQLVGTNFSDVAASNIVYFGAVRALVVAASPTSLTVVIPSGATFAPPSVTVNGLSGQANRPFLPTYAGDNVLDSSSFAPKVDFVASSPQATVAIGDLDGDGKPDLLVGNYNASSVSVYRNISSNGVINATAFAPRVTFSTSSMPMASLADVDGDGKLDILVANNGGGGLNTISIFRNTSVPGALTISSFAARVSFTTGFGPLKVVATDLDGDGRPDLVVPNGNSGGISVLRNLSTPGVINTASFAARVDIATGSSVRDAVAADLDGDGKTDLAVANFGSSTVSLLRNIAIRGSLTTNSFGPKVTLTTGSVYNLAVGDLDGDGKLDLAVDNRPSSVGVFRNLSTPGNLSSNTFAAKVSFPVSGEPYMVAIGDVDGDGKPDLAASVMNLNSVAVLRNTATPGTLNSNSFGARVLFATSTSPRNVMVGDLDADGRPDLAVANLLGSAVVSVLKNTSPFARPPTVVEVTPTNLVVNEGHDAAFTATAQGTGPIYYQWLFAGNPLADENNAVLNLTSVQYAQAGLYSVIASNIAGVATSSNAVLVVNRLPVADVGATDLLVISPNGSNAVAVLDGSQSSDPDGDALTYDWFHTGDATAFASGVVAVTTLPVGTNPLTLVVSDGLGTGSQAFAIEVITTSEAVDRLITLVQTDVEKATSLVASLRAALAAIDRSQPETAINQLETFINKVHAQLEPSDPALAAQLIAEAQAIIDALNGGTAAPAVTLEITSISQGNNGKPHLKIKGAAGRVHIVETSTDMVNWVKVGVAGCCGGCEYEFDDAQTSSAGARFYRVVSPK